jgi:hypothetical protein
MLHLPHCTITQEKKEDNRPKEIGASDHKKKEAGAKR